MTETRIGYARCSTDKQDLAAQQVILQELGVAPDRIYTDRGFTGTTRARPGLDQALAAVRAGDTLVVPKLDRLARSVPEARQIADALVERGVKLALGTSVYDPADPMGKMFFNILATAQPYTAPSLGKCHRAKADKITMDTKSKTPVGAYYEKHHMTGNRLRQSFMEDVRQQMFSSWIGRGKSVLDLGGRDGSLTRHFLDGNRVVLGDIDCAALAHAKETYAVETLEVNLNEPLPFDSDSYDVVVMAEVLEHLPYPQFTLSKVKRVLRDEGEVIGSIPLAYHLKDCWQVLCGKKLWMAGDPTHLQFFTYDEVLSTLSRFFRVEAVRVLKGGQKAEHWPRLFARNIAFRGIKK